MNFSCHCSEGVDRSKQKAALAQQSNTGTQRTSAWFKRYGEGLATLVSGILIIIAWLSNDASPLLATCLYLSAFVVGGFVKAKEGIETLIKEHDLDVNLLMIFAAIGAAFIGYWAEGAILIFIFSLSGALENYTMNRSHRDISALMEIKPETAVLYQDGREREVNIEQLVVGDLIIVKPGERLPADGLVKEGRSAVDQASITGESIPVDKTVGDEVFAGTLNGEGALFIEVTKPSEASLFSKIIKLVQEAQSEQPASQLWIKRFERIYARAILLVTALLIVVPPLLMSTWSWNDAIYKAMVFLVVASPCALVASIMPAMLSAISNGARHGLLFKGGAHLEHLAQIKAIAFDKTGTLTLGQPRVTDLVSFQGYTREEMLQVAATIESLSKHPLAEAIVREAEQKGLAIERPEEFVSLTGKGIQAQWQGEFWKIGKPDLIEEDKLAIECKDILEQLQQEGKTVTVLFNSKGIVGIIALQDQIRPQAKQAIAQLKNMGIKVAMLTGDQEKTARAIAKEAGIDIVCAGLLPEDKVARLNQFKEEFNCVAMVGDGVNDAPALVTATVGIAMGGTGSDAALETADLVLMNDNLQHIAQAIQLGQRSQRVVKQNLIFSLAVITLLITVNFVHGIALPLGVIGHEGSTILVILNGLRLLR